MKIKTLFFGITRDTTGENSVLIELDKPSNIAEFQEVLTKKYSGLTQIKDFAIAVNETYVNNDFVLSEGDIVAIIPPVSGG